MKIRMEDDGFLLALDSNKSEDKFTFSVESKLSAPILRGIGDTIGAIGDLALHRQRQPSAHDEYEGSTYEVLIDQQRIGTDPNTGALIIPLGVGANETLENALWELMRRDFSRAQIEQALTLCKTVLDAITDVRTPASAEHAPLDSPQFRDHDASLNV